MGDIADQAASYLRDFETEGMPDSGDHDPEKSDGRSVFDLIDGLVYGIRRLHWGATEPADADDGTPWVDTTDPGGGLATLKVYDGADWIPIFILNTSTHTAALVASVSPPVLPGFLFGLGLSNNVSTPNTKIDVAAGQCADDGAAQMMVVAGGTIDCGTTGINALDTATLANSTCYHVFAISKADGTTALLASISVDSPTLPATYTLQRRLGSFRTDGSAHIKTFVQAGDLFQWKVPVADIAATNPGTSAVSRTLTVPTGVEVLARINAILLQGDAAGVSGMLSDLATSDTAPVTGSLGTFAQGINGISPTFTGEIRTNPSAQIRSRLSASNGNTILYINTLGWIDRRGQDG